MHLSLSVGLYHSAMEQNYPEFQCKIAIFAKDYMKLSVTLTPKLHAVMFHVAEFCLMMGQGLGPWIEQTEESVHHDFKETWQR